MKIFTLFSPLHKEWTPESRVIHLPRPWTVTTQPCSVTPTDDPYPALPGGWWLSQATAAAVTGITRTASDSITPTCKHPPLGSRLHLPPLPAPSAASHIYESFNKHNPAFRILPSRQMFAIKYFFRSSCASSTGRCCCLVVNRCASPITQLPHHGHHSSSSSSSDFPPTMRSATPPGAACSCRSAATEMLFRHHFPPPSYEPWRPGLVPRTRIHFGERCPATTDYWSPLGKGATSLLVAAAATLKCTSQASTGDGGLTFLLKL